MGPTAGLASTGIRSPDHPARSQLLYRLSYRARLVACTTLVFIGTSPVIFLRYSHVVEYRRLFLRPSSHGDPFMNKNKTRTG